MIRSVLKILPEISDALASHRPVVALESTIVAHGMPFPQNLDLSRDVSSMIRSKGVVPATIAIKDGVCRVGLSEDEISDLARAGAEGRALKCSTRDIPFIVAKDSRPTVHTEESRNLATRWGATTVASTIRLAHLAGISTFVTGGTGGVHRGGEFTMDISADLNELARSPVAVVSAGVKSILDIKRTLETLETLGVSAAAFGTDEFPAFFSPKSGVTSPARVESASDVARAFWAARDLGMPNGMLVAVPNIDPAGEVVESAIQEAVAEAEAAGIQGRDITPFILQVVAEKTEGESLRSNISLVKRNAEFGADVAISIAEESIARSNEGIGLSSSKRSLTQSRVIVMGGSVVDVVAKVAEGQDLIPATSNPGVCSESDGGAGRNVAEALGRLGAEPLLFSAVGNDGRGKALVQRLEQECGVTVTEESVKFVDDKNTATYLAILRSTGELHAAIADMDVLSHTPMPSTSTLAGAEILVCDANPPAHVLIEVAHAAVHAGVKVFFEPTSVPKAGELGRKSDFLSCLTYAFPSTDELFALADGWSDTPDELYEAAHEEDFRTIKLAATELLSRMRPDAAHLIVTLGSNGVMLASRTSSSSLPQFKHFPADEGIEVQNCTGAGDSLCAAFVHAILEGRDEMAAVELGMVAAVHSLQCADRAISPHVGN